MAAGGRPKSNFMKKLLTLAAAILFSGAVCAQNDVTKFLGIPVDGTKSEMIQKLKEKGYRYDSQVDCLKGEFNGRDVLIRVVTNNNKVYRILLADANTVGEADIRIRFNSLCRQFENNPKYYAAKIGYRIPEDEDISYEMIVHKKQYEAAFYQKSESSDEPSYKKSVWFTISEQFGKYHICMFYDNEYNQANGEDL